VGQFSAANLAYEWVVYSNGNQEDLNVATERLIVEAKLGRVQTLKQMGRYDQAAAILARINLGTVDDQLQAKLVYELILINYLGADYRQCLSRGLQTERLVMHSPYWAPT